MKEQEFNYGEWYIDELGDVVTDLKDNSGGDIICLQPEEWEESMKRWEKNRELIIAAPKMLNAFIKINKTFIVWDCLPSDLQEEIYELIKPFTDERI